MPDIEAIKNTPDVSFIENRTLEQVRGEMVADYEAYMAEATGETVKLSRSSPHRGILYAMTAQVFQAMQYIDRAGKQNLLKYSYGGFLDNIALIKGITRLPATAAKTTVKFTLSAQRTEAIGIPQGTRVTTETGIYFATDQYAEVKKGETYTTATATCTVAGIAGNGLAIGEVATIVDPVPYVKEAANTTTTAGGAEQESDEDLAERVYLAPSAYSTAGPEDGYIYHAKNYSPSVGDVVATSDQDAGTVDIVFLMADGTSPGTEMISGLKTHLRDGNIRPMTDLVTVAAPTEVAYTIDVEYKISRGDSAQAVTIQTAVAAAVEEYQAWQRKIGRDVNPSKLVAMIMAAGAKRVIVTAPTYAAVTSTKVAALSGTATVDYGGLEDD